MESISHKESIHQIGEMTTVGHSDCSSQNAANLNTVNIGSITSTQMPEVKKLGHISHKQPPKDTSTATPLAESEAMKKWLAMKQNGFLTHPHGGKPMPEPQFGKKSRKRKPESKEMEVATVEESIKKRETINNSNSNVVKTETEETLLDDKKAERVCVELHIEKKENKKINMSLPSGLLDGIDTGIIRRVRKCAEVQAVLDDVVQMEKKKPDGQGTSKIIVDEETGGNEITRLMNYQKHLIQSFGQASSASCSENPESTSCFTDRYENLLNLLTAYSDIINRKCDNILSIEHEINKQFLTRISNTSNGL